jgi:hypothetical protein
MVVGKLEVSPSHCCDCEFPLIVMAEYVALVADVALALTL